MKNKVAHRVKEVNGNSLLNLSDERIRIGLFCNEEPEYSFIADITLNKRIEFKISLHHQEHNTYTGLLRIDYRGRHDNPESANDTLPEIFKPYIGKEFGMDEPHIHLYVAEYKPLAWALPLKVYNFSVPNVSSSKEVIDAIYAFAKEINIISPITVQDSMI